MDIISHALLPYLLGIFFKRNKEEVTAFVLGGIAPDFDIFIAWIQYISPIFLMTHRGITHSFFFGFFTGLAVLYLATRPGVKAKVRQFIEFEPVISQRTILFVFAGVIIHLFLDYITTEGIPLLYPFTTTNYSAEVFFYIDIFLIILSSLIIISMYKKSFQREIAKKYLIIFLLFIVVLGAVRIEEKIAAKDFFNDKDISAYPNINPFEWFVFRDEDDNVTIYQYNGLEKTFPHSETFSRMNVIQKGENLNFALHTASEMPVIKMFKWRAYRIAVNASFNSGVWSLEYYDPMQKMRLHQLPEFFRRFMPELGSLKVMV